MTDLTDDEIRAMLDAATEGRMTHLLQWLEFGWHHCRNGTQEWAEAYLSNAKAVIEAQDAALIAAHAEIERLKRGVQDGVKVIRSTARAVRSGKAVNPDNLDIFAEVIEEDAGLASPPKEGE